MEQKQLTSVWKKRKHIFPLERDDLERLLLLLHVPENSLKLQEEDEFLIRFLRFGDAKPP